MSTFQPYGGLGWPLACLLPPSAISLFATVLLKLEGSQRGVTWDTLSLQITSQFPFSAATVFGMLALDVVLYSALAWYLDRVSHPQPEHTVPGQRLHASQAGRCENVRSCWTASCLSVTHPCLQHLGPNCIPLAL